MSEKTCGCVASDAWRCAKKQRLDFNACPCGTCHHDEAPAPAEPEIDRDRKPLRVSERLQAVQEAIFARHGITVRLFTEETIPAFEALLDSEAALRERVKELEEKLSAYGREFHTKGCEHVDIAVANCCEGNDVALNAWKAQAERDRLRECLRALYVYLLKMPVAGTRRAMLDLIPSAIVRLIDEATREEK